VLDRLDPAVIDIHAARWTGRDTYAWRPDARRFETLEHSVALRLGLGAAVDHALHWGLEPIADRIAVTSALLRERLSTVPGVEVRDQGRHRSGIVTFTLGGRNADEVMLELRARGINTSVSRLELAWLDMEPRGIQRMLRASVHYYNTEEEIERLVLALGGK
jgi:cysteine desulfurase / selenocysteine lyase